MKFNLGQTVYHKEVYNYREPLKVVGIRENELELEGDYSGGTQPGNDKSWLPIEGVSTVYDYKFKKESREMAMKVDPTNRSKQDIISLQEIVLKLTIDIQ